MQSHSTPRNRVRQTLNDIVIAEIFLVQATIESATVIGSGINELGKQIIQRDEPGEHSISTLLQRIADDAVEPYSSRYQYFRQMINTAD
jgi:hypothetical protein